MTEIEFNEELKKHIDPNLEFGFLAGTEVPYTGSGLMSARRIDGFIVWKKVNGEVIETTMKAGKNNLQNIINFLK